MGPLVISALTTTTGAAILLWIGLGGADAALACALLMAVASAGLTTWGVVHRNRHPPIPVVLPMIGAGARLLVPMVAAAAAIALVAFIALFGTPGLAVAALALAVLWLWARIARTRSRPRLLLLLAWIAVAAAAVAIVSSHDDVEVATTSAQDGALGAALEDPAAAACLVPYRQAAAGDTADALEGYGELLTDGTEQQRECARLGVLALAPSCARASELVAVGRVQQARSVLGSILDRPTDQDQACASAMLAKLDQPTSPIDIAYVEATRGMSTALTGDAPDQGAAPDLGALEPIVRFLVWLLPLLLVLLTIREIVFGYQLRRPGPVELELPTAAGADAEGATKPDLHALQAVVQERLARAGVDRAPLTPGGVGALTIPVAAAVDATFPKLGALAKDVIGFVIPPSGYVVSTTLRRRDGAHAITVDLRPRCDGGAPAQMFTVDGSSWDDAADKVACKIYATITSFGPVARRQTVWNRWSGSGQGLTHHQRGLRYLDERRTLDAVLEFRSAAHLEPASAVTRIEWSRAYAALARRTMQSTGFHREAQEDSAPTAGTPDDLLCVEAGRWFLAAVETAASAVLLAPTLVEARLRLAVSLNYAAWWLGEATRMINNPIAGMQKATSPIEAGEDWVVTERLAEMLWVISSAAGHQPVSFRRSDDLRPIRRQLVPPPQGNFQRDHRGRNFFASEEAEANLMLLAASQFRLAEQLLGWTPMVVRWLDRTTRASVGRAALPFHTARQESKDGARAARWACRLSAKPTSLKGVRRHLAMIRARRFLRPRGSDSPASFNLAIAYLRLSEAVDRPREEEPLASATRYRMEAWRALVSGTLANRRTMDAAELDILASDPDLWPERSVGCRPGARRPLDNEDRHPELLALSAAPSATWNSKRVWWGEMKVHLTTYAVEPTSDIEERRKPFNPFEAIHAAVLEVALARTEAWEQLGHLPRASVPEVRAFTARARRLIEEELAIAAAGQRWLVVEESEGRHRFLETLHRTMDAQDLADWQRRVERYRPKLGRVPPRLEAQTRELATRSEALFHLLNDPQGPPPIWEVLPHVKELRLAWARIRQACLTDDGWPSPQAALTD